MTSRFERLYELPQNLYVAGSPIVIASGVLLKDKETNSVLVQLKLHNVSGKRIKALKVSVSAYDISGKKLQGVEDYQYLDLSVQNGQYFGAQKAIIMPEAVTRLFSIAGITVIFEDLSIWDWDKSAEFEAIPAQPKLYSLLQSDDLVKQYQLATSEQAEFQPIRFGPLWICSCGEVNSESQCTKCQVEKTTVFSAFDKDILSAHLCERLAYEKRIKEAELERQRHAAEEKAARKAEVRKVVRKYFKIAAAPVAAVMLAVVVFLFVTCQNKNLTIDKVLALETKDNVVSLLGKPKNSDVENSYDITFMGTNYFAIFHYDDNDRLSDCTFTYSFSGMRHIEKAIDLLDYKPTDEDISEARRLINQLLETFTEQFGEPEHFNSPVETTTYTWFADTTQIELIDIVANESLSLIGAIDLRFSYNVKPNQTGDTVKPPVDINTQIELREKNANAISAGHRHTVGLKADGTVIAVGDYGDGQCNISHWSDIKSLAAGIYYTVGLKENGTVVTAGGNYYGQCNVSEWTDIAAIAAGFGHTVGLKSDGTVLAVGWNEHGQCEVSNWTDIVSIAADHKHTLGLKVDGTVVAAGDNSYGRCEVSEWTDIVAIATGIRHSVGLKADGTVVTAGDNSSNQCDVANWTNIIAIAAGEDFTVGLQANGTVMATGWNMNGQCDVSGWTDIVSIAAGESHTVGLRANGTVVAVGLNDYGQCDVANWTDILIDSSEEDVSKSQVGKDRETLSGKTASVDLTLDKLQGVWQREIESYNDYYDYTACGWERITIDGTYYREDYQMMTTPELTTTCVQEGIITAVGENSFTVSWTYGLTQQSDGSSWQPSINEPSTYPVSKITDTILMFTVYPYYKQ